VVLLLLQLLQLLAEQLIQPVWQLPAPPLVQGVGNPIRPTVQFCVILQVALTKILKNLWNMPVVF
jgi:hypothetical protein